MPRACSSSSIAMRPWRSARRTRAGGMAVGVDGDPPLGMELVSNLTDVVVGDVIVSSGVDGIYPKGFTIGTVEKSERGPSLHRVIAVRPGVGFLVARRRAHRAGAPRAPSSSPARTRNEVVGVLVALAGALASDDAGGVGPLAAPLPVKSGAGAVIYVALAFGPGRAARRLGGRSGAGRPPAASSASGVFEDAGRVPGRPAWGAIIVAQSLPRLVMFVSGTIVHELCYQALYALVETRAFRMPWSAALTQAAVNGLIGILAFQLVESGPGLMQRRRARGATLSRRQY